MLRRISAMKCNHKDCTLETRFMINCIRNVKMTIFWEY